LRSVCRPAVASALVDAVGAERAITYLRYHPRLMQGLPTVQLLLFAIS
jgi:hypothetical protein